MTASGYLTIYLNDHRAGAVGGRRLGDRLASENRGTPWAETLAAVAREVRDDERLLDKIRGVLGVEGGTVKRVMAAVGQMVGQLKPNGRVLGYSPLSRVVELEALMSGILAKQRLWVSLAQIDEPALEALDSDQLQRKAQRQLDALADIHAEAAMIAFGESRRV